MKKKIIAAVTIILQAMLLMACGTSVYEKHSSGYVQETHVNGIVFDSPSDIIDQATAVTMITNDMESGTYLYKDGSDTYLLFNSESIVVMAQKGTEFNFDSSSDYLTTLKEHGLNSIWFDEIDKKFDYKTSNSNGNFKVVMNVKADVSITNDVYGIFAGELGVLKIGDVEYSIFIGFPGDTFETLSSSQKNMLAHVVGSLDENSNYDEPEETVEESESSAVDEQEDVEKEPIQVEEPEPVEETEAVDETVVDETENTEESTEIEEEQSDESIPVVLEEQETVEDNTAEDSDKTTSETIVENEEQNKTENTDSVVFSNQKNNKSEASSLYNMKSVGDTTVAAVQTFDSEDYKMTTVTIDSLLTGSDAESFLKKALGKNYKNADAGMSWNVIEYSTTVSTEEGYLDIRIEGLDGGKLVSKGIAYSKRTWDYFKYIEQNGSEYNKLYCYYQVPNGCHEYLLEMGIFGDNSEEVRQLNAYYKIMP